MNLHYNWTLKDAVFTKDKGNVFSCFSCGGGSTMGYKLVGFDVIGCNEIDSKMMSAYIENHKPKYAYLINKNELCKVGSFPLDYEFLKNKHQYLIGMSVPPLMMARIAEQIQMQWLSKILQNVNS